MKFSELRPVLADTVVEVTTYDEVRKQSYEVNLDSRNPEKKLLDAIFTDDLFKPLDNLEVDGVYVMDNGFSINFAFSYETLEALDTFAKKNKYIHSVISYPLSDIIKND